MAFHCETLEHFVQLRERAAVWREFETQLSQLEDNDREFVRELLMQPSVDPCIDRTYEQRLYAAYQAGRGRVQEGLVPPQTPSSPILDTAHEALRDASSPRTPLPSPDSTREAHHDASPPRTPPRMSKTYAELSSIILPQSPELYYGTYQPSPRSSWSPTSLTSSQLEQRVQEAEGQDTPRSILEWQPTDEQEETKQQNEQPTQRPRRHKRKHRPIFSDEALRTVRSSPPRTRARS